MLSKLHIRDVCLLGKGSAQCRFLADADGQYHCLKQQKVQNKIIHDEIEKFCNDNYPYNSDLPFGDNCQGFPILKHTEQGYDITPMSLARHIDTVPTYSHLSETEKAQKRQLALNRLSVKMATAIAKAHYHTRAVAQRRPEDYRRKEKLAGELVTCLRRSMRYEFDGRDVFGNTKALFNPQYWAFNPLAFIGNYTFAVFDEIDVSVTTKDVNDWIHLARIMEDEQQIDFTDVEDALRESGHWVTIAQNVNTRADELLSQLIQTLED